LKVGADPTVLVSSDYPIAIGQDGNLYYPSGPPGSLKIMRRLPSGETSVLATLPATAKGPLLHINGISAGPHGSLYYTEDSAIRRITAQGEVSTVATVTALVGGPSIPGTDQHPYLRGLAVDPDGVMYVADNGDARVLKITADGKMTTLLQLESPWSPTAVARFGDDLFVLEFLHKDNDVRRDWLPRVRKIASDGKATIIMTVDQMPGARPAGAGFDPKRDAAKDIEGAIQLAQRTNKRVLIVVGDNECGWCCNLAEIFATNEEVAKLLHNGYVVVKVNMNPANENKQVLSRFPKIPGYPHLFVLDQTGIFLESQRTLLLHSGDRHDPAKVISFLKTWEPDALGG
jgi:hypothetical protein